VTLVALGNRHGCLVKQDNTLWCWGSNTNGQLGIGAITPPKTTPVQVTNLPGTITALSAGRDFTCAAVDNGTLFCWGRNTNGQLGDGTKNDILSPNIVFAGGFVNRVSCGREHTCAVRSGGIVCWGLNAWGNLGDGTTTDRLSPVQVMEAKEASAILAQGNFVAVLGEHRYEGNKPSNRLVQQQSQIRSIFTR
jgi:alpha-tubulin suppressor-like RCC1 family protein